ncbi:MAG: hypothetical protein KDC61_22050 [Saprospiraceae bacterium]|nr:hypothetical protein [Saprospiraceae bacterium]MCB0577258.1 hypothetical protein [Saprospiraceae bacterium]
MKFGKDRGEVKLLTISKTEISKHFMQHGHGKPLQAGIVHFNGKSAAITALNEALSLFPGDFWPGDTTFAV